MERCVFWILNTPSEKSYYGVRMIEKDTSTVRQKREGAKVQGGKAGKKSAVTTSRGKSVKSSSVRSAKRAQLAPQLGGSTIKGFSPLSSIPPTHDPVKTPDSSEALRILEAPVPQREENVLTLEKAPENAVPVSEKTPASKNRKGKTSARSARKSSNAPEISADVTAAESKTEKHPVPYSREVAGSLPESHSAESLFETDDACDSEEMDDLLNDMLRTPASGRMSPARNAGIPVRSDFESGDSDLVLDDAGSALSRDQKILKAARLVPLLRDSDASGAVPELGKTYISAVMNKLRSSLTMREMKMITPEMIAEAIRKSVASESMSFHECDPRHCILLPDNEVRQVSGSVLFDYEPDPEDRKFVAYFVRVILEDGSKYNLSNPSGIPLFHGDEVAGIFDTRNGIFYVGRVTEYHNSVVGRVMKRRNGSVLAADDPRFGNCTFVFDSEEALGEAVMGSVVVCDIVSRNPDSVFRIKTSRVLGELGQLDVQIQLAVLRSGIPHEFGKRVQEQLVNIPEEVPESDKRNRRDIRELPLVTIDGEDARDFDDAVYCRREDDGFRLWVAIADVSYYVRPDTPLDAEAAKRGNSVYFPNYVVPMLPEKLSNGLCSLNPHVDRLCFVCEVFVSGTGELGDFSFYQAVMRSHARLTYTDVAGILAGREPDGEFRSLVSHIRDLHALYRVLKDARIRRGTVDFESEEVRFVFDENLNLTNIVPLVRNDAHMLIEECMIAANICAARMVDNAHGSTLYRVHSVPSLSKLAAFRAFITPLGYRLDGGDSPQPSDYARLAESFKDSPNRKVLNVMMLRSMSLAEYSPVNQGHFGLALSHYAHFTSPIRRYPDLQLHRELKHLLLGEAGVKSGAREYRNPELLKIADQCNLTERRADQITGEVARTLKARFMEQFIGKTLPGVISNVEAFGIFVVIERFHVDGMVHISRMNVADYLIYDRNSCTLVGDNTGIRFRIGDPVQVRIDEVDVDAGKIGMSLVLKNQKKGKKSGKKTSSQEQSEELTVIPELVDSGLPGEEVNRRIISSLRTWSGKESTDREATVLSAGGSGMSAGRSVEKAVVSEKAGASEFSAESSNGKSPKSGKSRKKSVKGGNPGNAVSGEADGNSLENLMNANPEFRELYSGYLKEKEALSIQEENLKKLQDKVEKMRQELIRHFVSTVL